MAQGWIWGKIKGKQSSTDATLEIVTVKTLNLKKQSGEDYWYYSTALTTGIYDCTATDVTGGGSSPQETKQVTINADQWTACHFDISS